MLFGGLTLYGAPLFAQQVAPLVPKVEPPLAAEMIVRFHEALALGLKRGGLSVMDPSMVRKRLKLAAENAGCFEGHCLQMNRTAVGLDFVATAKVSAVGKNYSLVVRLYKGNAIYSKYTGRCDVCTMAEVVQSLLRMSEELGTRGEEPPAGPKPPIPSPTPLPTPAPSPGPKGQPEPGVKPTPSPAASPRVASSAEPGVTQPGPESGHQAEPPRDTGPVTKKKPWPMWPALVAAGVGVVGLAVGIPLIAIDGEGADCKGEPKPDLRNCSTLYDTAAGGWVMTGIGIGALAASGAFFYLYYSTKNRERKSVGIQHLLVMPSPAGGAFMGAGGRF